MNGLRGEEYDVLLDYLCSSVFAGRSANDDIVLQDMLRNSSDSPL